MPILLYSLLSTAGAAEYLTKGEASPYDGICFEESIAEKLLGDIVTLKPLENQNYVLRQEVVVCKSMNDNYVEEIKVCKQAVTDLNATLATQIDITNKAAKDCKTLINNAKPSFMDDLWKVLSGVGIGILIHLL